MDPYRIVLFIHFLGLVGLFVGYGLEWMGTAVLLRSKTGDEARSALRIYRTSLPLSGPSLIVLILSGGYLAGVSGASKEGWIIASILGIIVALGMGFALVMPRMRALRATLPEGNAALVGPALSKVQDGFVVTLIRARFFLALGIVYVMTIKPMLISSLAVLFGGIVLGILASATTWSKPGERQVA
ncbi:MAG TPA: DUF2269 family protein [Candidatus Acidoferrum sp.]|jgi:hypothetical protein